MGYLQLEPRRLPGDKINMDIMDALQSQQEVEQLMAIKESLSLISSPSTKVETEQQLNMNISSLEYSSDHTSCHP